MRAVFEVEQKVPLVRTGAVALHGVEGRFGIRVILLDNELNQRSVGLLLYLLCKVAKNADS